jgi:REP element-mobilizing transposase RayT
MARPLRIEVPGAFYHVVQKGIEKRSIFQTSGDRERFLSYLSSAKEPYGSVVHSYSLLKDHYHLLLETPAGNLSSIMHYINTSYAAYFNSRTNRKGPLYQGRYKAVLVEPGEYLGLLSRYIHLSPVRERTARSAVEYRWSSSGVYTGEREAPDFLETGTILSFFAKTRKAAEKKYAAYISDIGIDDRKMLKDNTRKGIVVGSPSYLYSIVEKFLQGKDDPEIPVLRTIQKTGAVDIKVLDSIAGKYAGYDRRLKRRLFLYLAKKYSGLTLKGIANYCGDLSDTGVSQAFKRMQNKREEDGKLDRFMSMIEKEALKERSAGR